ncbi:MAG: response regulator [Cyanobacteria bacterium P01_H01_bin.15]
MSPADELAGLLNLNLTHTGVESPHLSTPTVMTPEALTAKTLIFYEAIDTLDLLIETESPVSVVISEQDFEQLSAFIELPTHQSLSALAESLSIPESSSNEDDKFKDLEQLLEQTNRAIASQAPQAKTGRPLLPARAVANQLFEQTMRVPVRQLDSLNNLIGELVVNRNTLEGEQEKLRQFLDNLLNQVQKLSDVGGRMQDLYERTLLEGALLASRQTVAVTAGESGGNGNGTPVIKTLTAAAAEGESEDEQGLGALEMDRFTGFHLLSQEMIELIVRVRESASDIQFLVDETEQVSRNLRQVTTQLQEGVNKSRMVPFAQTADRLPRAVRDISHRLNKQAELVLVGRDVLIDKMIVEQLYNPMTHLVNNAITHGIEPPHERQGRGKSAVGQIKIESFLQGNQTVISVSDDGAGIDPDQVKTKAIEKGLILQSEAKHLSYQDVYDLLFHPGFSTKDQADDFAGRGVGMDVVRTSLDAIRGSVSVDSTLGAGTTFTIRLPLTLSICKALSCVSERARIAFPMDGVDGTKVFLPGDVETNEQGERCVNWHERLLPLRPLSDLLAHNRQLSRGSIYGGIQGDDTVSVVFLRGASNLLAIQVDQVIGEQEIVIKQIEGPVPKPAGIAGATVLGDGSVMPIGDVLELIEISQGRLRTESSTHLWQKTAVYQQQQAQIPEKQEPLVLVVDDSITVRELLSISFGKAGYRVEQARDGQEAWEKIRSGLPCDLIFCDIEMPRMNGLELLSRLQKDEEFKEIPVAMLTSRGAERHRKVAGELGSCGYFTKPYTERDILNAAARMLKGEILLSTSAREPQQEPTTAAISAPPEEAPNLPALKTGKTVLIIDDSVMVREMLSMTFKQDGYHVEQARDGAEALEKLQSGLDCDVVFCDIEMPRMNGLELLSMMQQDSELSQVPVAMITSRGAERHRKIAAQRGARGYFTKPYIESELLAAAQALMDGQVLIENS